MTALAALASLPVLGLGGVAAFRAMVRHYTPINPRKPSGRDHESTASRTDEIGRSVIEEDEVSRDIDHGTGEVSVSVDEPRHEPEGVRKPSAKVTQKYERLKAQLENDQEVLEGLAKATPPASQPSSGFLAWIGYGITEESVKNVQEIARSIVDVQSHTHKFIQIIASMDEKKESDIELLSTTRDRLGEVAVAMTSYKEHFEVNGKVDQVAAIEEILRTIDILIGQLPKGDEVSKSFWDRLGGTFGQSQKKLDLAWKVMKYETQIVELKKHMEIRFESILKQELESSWVDLGEEVSKEDAAIKRLYRILAEVEIDLENGDRFNQTYLGQVRNLINEELIPAFREEFRSNSANSNLHAFAEILFTDVTLEKQCFETLDIFNKMGATFLGQEPDAIDEGVHGEHLFVKWVNTVYRRIGAVPYAAKAPLLNQWANSARGQWNRNFDPYRQGNPTHHFWNLQVGDRMVKMLGMGTPTNEDYRAVGRLNEEFVALMRGYKTNGKKHLFVNNQNLIPKTGWLSYFINGDETQRCNLILDKQDEEDVKGAYFAIALAKNSKFYSQSGEYANQGVAEAFKANLFYQVCEGDRKVTGCYIPETIRELIPDFDEKANNIIDQIHRVVFAGRKTLSLEERRWFIELFYDNLVKMILVEGKFDSMNGSCKDQIDRGAGTNAQLAANCYIIDQEDGELTKEQQQHVMMLMMVRALLVRKRPPLPERVERFSEGMDMSFKHVAQLKALHGALFPGVKFTPQRVASAA